MKFETGWQSPSQPEAPKPAKKTLWERVKESRLAKAALLAGALHAPLKQEVAEPLARAAEHLRSDWERPNMVLHPQTPAEQAAIRHRIAERESHADPKAREAYKADLEQRLESGKDIPFGKSYFDLARLNGASPEEVQNAEQKSSALVDKYAKEFGTDLDENELKKLSLEMYGPDEAYDWGQASAIAYFNKGERNCEAIAQAQDIVLEGVLARMPAENRAQWQTGLHYENQHVAATLAHLDKSGKRDTLYILEGKSTRALHGADEPGTANVPMTTLKKAMVGSSPVKIEAATEKGVKVNPGPRLDLVTDTPVELNIDKRGTFRKAQFNVDEAEREGLKPREITAEELEAQRLQEEALKDKTIEITGLHEGEVQGPEVARRLLERDVGTADDGTVILDEVDARELAAPTPETIRVFREKTSKGLEARTVHYGDMSQWSPEAIRQAFRNKNPRISIHTVGNAEGGYGLSENVLEQMAAAGAAGESAETLAIEMEQGPEGSKYAIMPIGQLSKLLSTHAAKTIDMSSMYTFHEATFADADATIIREGLGKGHVLKINGGELTPARAHELAKAKGRVLISPDAYWKLLMDAPDLITSTDHFTFNPDGASAETLFTVARAIRDTDPTHPLNKELRDMIRIQMAGSSMYDTDEDYEKALKAIVIARAVPPKK